MKLLSILLASVAATVGSVVTPPIDPPVDPEPPAPVIYPLQIASSRGELMALEVGARSTANLKQTARTRHYTGTQPLTELRVCFAGYFVDTATSSNFWTCVERDATSSHIIRCNIELNGVSIPVTFSGVRDGVVMPGDPCYMSDPVYPAQFGLDVFAANSEFWLRAERQYAVGAFSMFHQSSTSTTAIAGERFFAGSASAPSQLDALGEMTTTGGWTAQAHLWFPLAFVGRPTKKMMSVITLGASIENGVGDGLGDGLNGSGGYMRKMLANVGGKKIARLHLAKSGETAKSYLANSAKRRVMYQFATHILSGHGGNDFSTNEARENTQMRWEQIWAFRTPNIVWQEHYALSVKSNSTDGWVTVANQTPRPGFETGGNWRDPANAWCAAQVAANDNLDGFRDLTAAQADATRIDCWRGDIGKPTDDGTHPNKPVADAMAAANSNHLETLRAAHEDAA